MKEAVYIKQANRMAAFASQLAQAVEDNDNDQIMLNIGRVHGAAEVMKETIDASTN